jgi:hypothetical protein
VVRTERWAAGDACRPALDAEGRGALSTGHAFDSARRSRLKGLGQECEAYELGEPGAVPDALADADADEVALAVDVPIEERICCSRVTLAKGIHT